MLLLGTGHCFRDHVLEVCPEFARFSSDAEGIRKSFEGSSLETIKHMVAVGHGRDGGAAAAASPAEPQPHVRYMPFAAPVPTRRVVLAWRRSFTALRGDRRAAQRDLRLRAAGVTRLS